MPGLAPPVTGSLRRMPLSGVRRARWLVAAIAVLAVGAGTAIWESAQDKGTRPSAHARVVKRVIVVLPDGESTSEVTLEPDPYGARIRAAMGQELTDDKVIELKTTINLLYAGGYTSTQAVDHLTGKGLTPEQARRVIAMNWPAGK